MKPHRLVLPLALAAVVVAAGGGTAARADATCPHANAVFYTTDTTDLSKQLGAVLSPCTEYWISISPITAVGPDTGKARGGTPLTTIHAQGPQFHALAELRPVQWFTYAVTQGHGWYAAGQVARDSLLTAGYDPARDTWAVNEIGTPSSPVNTDPFFGVDASRDGFRQFVKGLYDGTSGSPLPGLVFAANPPQLAPDIPTYERALSSFYADSGFWEDMQRYVRFWAQETYADVRAWGVPGTTLDERAGSLNEYFMHGVRLPASAAAQDFLTHAYTPLGNASWRQMPPVPAAGPGFGSTDVDQPVLRAFLATQTYALRLSSGAQFGFAVVPKNPPTPADRTGLEGYLGTLIRSSQSDPAGGCAGGACDGDLAGSAFPESWHDFATPPLVVAHVSGPRTAGGWYVGDVAISWDVTDPQTGVDSSSGCADVTVTEDTLGSTYTCNATSPGGTTSRSVTIKRDATAPTVTCTPTPSTLWPPNGKLVPVDIAVDVADATSGPAGFVLTSAPDGWEIGTADVSGLLRATKDSTYTLTYTASDAAGNTATCEATVTVPHDQGVSR